LLVGEAMSISWKQLAAIPDSAMKQRILKALDITPPPEGIAGSFQDAGLFITKVEDGFSFMDANHPETGERNHSYLLATPRDVIKACRWPVGTPTGEAIRNWLVGHGYVRPGQRPAEPTDNTRTII
jgi:hypothetical protein